MYGCCKRTRVSEALAKPCTSWARQLARPLSVSLFSLVQPSGRDSRSRDRVCEPGRLILSDPKPFSMPPSRFGQSGWGPSEAARKRRRRCGQDTCVRKTSGGSHSTATLTHTAGLRPCEGVERLVAGAHQAAQPNKLHRRSPEGEPMVSSVAEGRHFSLLLLQVCSSVLDRFGHQVAACPRTGMLKRSRRQPLPPGHVPTSSCRASGLMDILAVAQLL